MDGVTDVTTDCQLSTCSWRDAHVMHECMNLHGAFCQSTPTELSGKLIGVHHIAVIAFVTVASDASMYLCIATLVEGRYGDFCSIRHIVSENVHHIMMIDDNL